MNINGNIKKTAPKLALFMSALIWGSSFIVMKSTVDAIPIFTLLAIRFTAAFVILSLVFIKRLKKIRLDDIWKGAVIGFCLFAAYVTQTIGITDTTPGKNAFLTAIYCVIVPFLFWLVNKTKPDKFNIISALLCVTGIGLVSLTNGFSMSFGDTFTIIGGFFFAAHIVCVSKFGKDKDPVIITVFQFGFSGLYAWIIALATEKFPSQWPTETLTGLIYLSVMATAVSFLFQNIGQKYTNPSSASIILSLEAVFGVLFSVILYGEKLTFRMAAGFLLIFIAVIMSETKLRFIKITDKSIDNT